MLLSYQPYDATYAVSFTSECPYIAEGISTLTYDIAISHLKSDPTHHFLEVTQSNVVMNGEEDPGAFDTILLMAADSISRLELQVTLYGRVVGLANHEEIKARWQQVRALVESQYLGDRVKAYLDSMEIGLATPESTWQALQQSFFYTCYFTGLYGNYAKPDFLEEEIIIHDLLNTEPVRVNVQKRLEAREEGKNMTLHYQADHAVAAFSEDTVAFFKQSGLIENMPQTGQVQLKGTYHLQEKTGKICGATQEAHLSIGHFYQKRITISITEM